MSGAEREAEKMRSTARMGARIRARRLDLGLKQAALAEAVGISAPYLNLIEHDRRPIGGRLLLALARALNTPAQDLAEGAEAGLVAALGQAAAADPRASAAPEALGDAADLAARFPEWAQLVARQSRRISDLEAAVETLSDRLTHDPRLAAALHEVLSRVTAIRSTAAILNEEGELPRNWLDRFHGNLDADARRLASVSRDLVAYLEGEAGSARPGAPGQARLPQEVFEDWLAGGAADLPPEGDARALAEAWAERADADARAIPLPEAAAQNLDPFQLAQSSGQPLSRVFRRLAAFSPDWGLVSADAAGALLLRKPVPGFLIPRLGAACALWPLFLATSRPMQPFRGRIEQLGRLPRVFRFWAICEPLAGSGLNGPAVFQTHMLLAPDHTDPDGPAEPVGTSCRVCPRADCPARREASVLPS